MTTQCILLERNGSFWTKGYHRTSLANIPTCNIVQYVCH